MHLEAWSRPFRINGLGSPRAGEAKFTLAALSCPMPIVKAKKASDFFSTVSDKVTQAQAFETSNVTSVTDAATFPSIGGQRWLGRRVRLAAGAAAVHPINAKISPKLAVDPVNRDLNCFVYLQPPDCFSAMDDVLTVSIFNGASGKLVCLILLPHGLCLRIFNLDLIGEASKLDCPCWT